MEGVDPRQIKVGNGLKNVKLCLLQALQALAQQDPEIIKLTQLAEYRALVHEHTQRCWKRCDIAAYARNSSIRKFGQKNKNFNNFSFSAAAAENCLNNCVQNWFTSQSCAGDYMDKKLGNKSCC